MIITQTLDTRRPSAAGTGRACQVMLVDRRTGRPHRVGGRALTLFTRTPSEAAAELLAGRDPALWEVRISPVEARGDGR